jgi:hypothetical protein
MFKWSEYLGHDQQTGDYVFSLTDSCFGTITIATTDFNGFMTNGEACTIAREYYRRNLNVALNLAAYYFVRRGGRQHRGLGERIAHAYMAMQDTVVVINRELPQLNYRKLHYNNVAYYITNARKLLAPRLGYY